MRISDWSSDVCSSDLTVRPESGGWIGAKLVDQQIVCDAKATDKDACDALAAVNDEQAGEWFLRDVLGYIRARAGGRGQGCTGFCLQPQPGDRVLTVQPPISRRGPGPDRPSSSIGLRSGHSSSDRQPQPMQLRIWSRSWVKDLIRSLSMPVHASVKLRQSAEEGT